MFTVCPKCALTLVVTATDLRVAQGHVRCGRCSSVFNALARLSEERQGSPAEATSAADEALGAAEASEPSAPPADAPSGDPESAAADALEFDAETTDLNSVFVQAQPDPEWTAATGSFRAMVAANQEDAEPQPPQPQPQPQRQVDVEIDSDFLASILRAEHPEEPAARVPPVPPPAADPQSAPPPPAAAAPADPPDAAQRALRSAGEGSARSRPPRRAALRPALPPPSAALTEAAVLPEEPEVAAPSAQSLSPGLWLGGSLVAALLLLAQILNHYRDDLATHPGLNRPLSRLYGALGVKLFPHWDLHAYDVRQLGADAAAGEGLITVRASVKNAAPQPQPLPFLRVTLQDRFGNRIASRDVAPVAYLPPAVAPAAYLSAGQRIDAEMGFADPGADAVGFEIDACLPARGGAIACANDAMLR